MKKTRLVVIAPALTLKNVDYDPLIDGLQTEEGLKPETTVWEVFNKVIWPLGGRSLERFSADLAQQINTAWVHNDGFEDVILMGHSAGGLLVRQAYLSAWGIRGGTKYAWAEKVSRLVLLAAPNRGVSRMRWHDRVGDVFLRVFFFFLHFTYQDLLEGSAFVTNLRIDWIRDFHARSGAAPMVLQLRGGDDDIVDVNASSDVLAFPNSAPVPMPGNHRSIVDIEARGEPDPSVGQQRYELIRNALLRGPESLGLASDALKRERREPSFEDCVFILHGIRARNMDEWLRKIQGLIVASGGRTMAFSPSYEYFSALKFVLPSVRRRNIRFLQNAYTEHLAENPDARFHIIAHSNGTYMVGQSLKDVPAMQFDRMVLAASVLPTDTFREARSQFRERVKAVRADGGQSDVPVGVLCRILRNVLCMRDLGTAGYDGFAGDFVKEYRHPGGHSGMFTETNIRSMVDFVLGKESGETPKDTLPKDGAFPMIARAAPFLTAGLLLLLFALPLLIGWLNPVYWYGGLLVFVVVAAIILEVL